MPRPKKCFLPVECASPKCSEMFIPKNGQHKYCGSRCRVSYLKKRWRVGPSDRLCRWCNQPFRTNNGSRRFCKPECRIAQEKEAIKRAKELKERMNEAGEGDLLLDDQEASLQVQLREEEPHRNFDGNSLYADEIEKYLAKGGEIRKFSIKTAKRSKRVNLNELGGEKGILY